VKLIDEKNQKQKISWHCPFKKGERFSRPRPGCHLPSSPWTGIIKFFSATESFVGDFPAGDGKTANLFYSVAQMHL